MTPGLQHCRSFHSHCSHHCPAELLAQARPFPQHKWDVQGGKRIEDYSGLKWREDAVKPKATCLQGLHKVNKVLFMESWNAELGTTEVRTQGLWRLSTYETHDKEQRWSMTGRVKGVYAIGKSSCNWASGPLLCGSRFCPQPPSRRSRPSGSTHKQYPYRPQGGDTMSQVCLGILESCILDASSVFNLRLFFTVF